MAIINGSFTGGTFAQYYSFYIEYFSTQNIANNTSQLTVNTYIRKDKATQTTYGNNKAASQSVDGTSRSTTFSYDFRNSTLKLVQSETYTVYHNADGTKSLYIGANATGGTSLLGAASAGATVTLPTIPRASTPTAYATTTGSNMRVDIAAAATAFRHEVVVAIGNYSRTVQAAAGLTSVLVPTDMAWANAIPNATSGTAAVTLRTYNGNTLIGTKTTTATLLVAASILPTVSGTLTPQNLLGGYYVQGKSGVKVTLSGAGSYESSIASYAGKVNNTSYASKEFTHTFINAGQATINGSANDTRGRTATWANTSIIVQPYNPPKIDNLLVIRCNANGTDNEQGEYIKVYVKADTTEVGSPNVNSHEFWYTYMLNGGTAIRVNLPSTAASIDHTAAPVYVGQESTIEVFAYAKDAYSIVHQYNQVPTVFALMDFRVTGKGIAFGKSSEIDALEVNLDTFFYKKRVIFPVGAIYMSIDATNPSVYFGGTWVRFANGKVLVGVDETQAEFNSVQKTGGEKTHTLSINEIPSHTHAVYMAVYQAGVVNDGGTNATGTSGSVRAGETNEDLPEWTRRAQDTGGDAAHNNMQPYITCYIWLRTA